MTHREYLKLIGEAFFRSFWWLFLVIPPLVIYGVSFYLERIFYIDQTATLIVGFSLCQVLSFFFILYGLLDDYSKELFHKLKDAEEALDKDIKEFEKHCHRKEDYLLQKENEIKTLIYSTTPFKEASKLASEMALVIFSETASRLTYKRNPALKAAQEVRALRAESKKILLKSKEVEYKYEYILKAFPEIAEYVDSDEDLLAVGEHMSYDELAEQRDKRKDYLSDAEYRNLTEDEKSQLALNRYLASSKSKWQIGRDYEMSCAMQMIKRGYKVELNGIKMRLEDMGRDLIATRNIGGLFGSEIRIIQCKNWSKEKTIHENVVFQLFGTTVEYESCHKCANQLIIPVLMIPPHSVISDKATAIAQKLKIEIERVPFVDFPRIKCNVNHGEKIYHLPFDQLYDRAEIKLEGEFYAWDVAEAASQGFRRAHRHVFH